MIIVRILFLAVIGGAIGWITNVMAIKMLFRPFNPIKLPLLNIEIQGLIPKRRYEIAQNIGNTVKTELVSLHEIINRVVTEENKEEVVQSVKKKVCVIIDSKIPAFIPSAIKDKIVQYVEEQFDRESRSVLDATLQGVVDRAVSSIDIGKMVEDKINEFELEKVEKIILQIAAKELKSIEVLGGVLGFLIGLLQGFITLYI